MDRYINLVKALYSIIIVDPDYTVLRVVELQIQATLILSIVMVGVVVDHDCGLLCPLLG